MSRIIDDPKFTEERASLIRKKKLLNNLYNDYYHIFLEEIKAAPAGKIVELGSGGGFLKEIIPDVITSDIMKLADCDKCFSAEKMPFGNNSLSGILMLNVFHHIKNPKKALSEFSRCLKKGGVVVMIEPYNSVFSRFVYTHFHHENFSPKAGWKIQGKGPLSDANGAIPWIIFERDKEKFIKLFPFLRIEKLLPHTPIRYLLSGGLSGPQLVPGFMDKYVAGVEKLLTPLVSYTGMFATIILKKV